MSKTISPYLKVRSQLPTFTIINCEHRNWILKLIGHTAILYKDTLTGQLMLLESTTLNKFTGKSGVQLTPFGAWLDHYPGKVFARIPKFEGKGNVLSDAREVLASRFIKEHLGTSYPNLKTMTGRFKLYMSSLDFKIFGRDWFTYTGNDKGIFCTELVIKMLQKCGLFGSWQYAHEYEPDNTRGKNVMFEELLTDVKYKPEIQLK